MSVDLIAFNNNVALYEAFLFSAIFDVRYFQFYDILFCKMELTY